MVEGKRKEGEKRRKRGRKGGKKREKGEELCQNRILKGVKKIYFPPFCKVPNWGKNIISERGGGGGEHDFWEKYIPLTLTEKCSQQPDLFSRTEGANGEFHHRKG